MRGWVRFAFYVHPQLGHGTGCPSRGQMSDIACDKAQTVMYKPTLCRKKPLEESDER